MDVNPDFWMLWAIALPLTLIILGIWRLTEFKNSEHLVERRKGKKGVGMVWGWLKRGMMGKRRVIHDANMNENDGDGRSMV